MMMLAIVATAYSNITSCTNKTAGSSKDANQSYEISYDLSFDIPEKYIDVDMTYIPTGKRQETVEFKLPVWAPGYYIIIDYPKDLTGFDAKDQNGNPLRWEKKGKNAWVVETADTVHVSYRIFSDFRTVAECRVEESAAFVPGNGVFMHVAGDVNHPVSVGFELPKSWSKISTSLEQIDGRYVAPNFDVLYDSPFLLGNQLVKTYERGGHIYEFALETPQGFEESPMAEDFLKAVDQAVAIFGETPYESYHLLLLGEGRGGLEHQSSQADYTAGHWDFATRAEYLDELMFLTHEYFHNYNVKAIRPIELGPFDYDRENFTTGLWFSEGITCYYESYLLMKAGIISDQEHLDIISDYIRNTQKTEGRLHMSMRESSYDIWLNFFNSNANHSATTISYYVKGPVIGFLLDARIRTMTSGAKSIDDLMKLLYDRFYKELGRGFTEEEFWAAAEEIAGGDLDMVRHYVDTADEIDYESILTPAGISIDRESWKMGRI